MFQDKTLVCRNCGNEFVFTAGEQEFYAEKGFENEPKMCKDCRRSKKEAGRQYYTAGMRCLRQGSKSTVQAA